MLGSNLTDIEMFDFNGRSSTHGVDLPDRENLSEVGRCGLAGPLAPWMAPSSPHGRVYGVSCSPTPSRQTISNPEPLSLLLRLLHLPLQVQGAALPNPFT